MADPLATPSDVRERLNLPEKDEFNPDGIEDTEIRPYLQDATFDLGRANPLDSIDDDVRIQLEWRLAGIKILSQRKGLRAYHQQSLGSMSRSYEVRSVEALRDEVENICRDEGLTPPIETDDPEFVFETF